ncbi:MAG: zinc-binding dehydrogenase [Terrimicrobiaceae bacterium]|nr:zinc-binding dehydrogenase [Terrimicrobiaceae bacterium]
MKALAVIEPGRLETVEMPRPEMGEFEALVRIEACGICSTTDRELIHGRQPFHSKYPCILGHESVGTVVETGRRVTSFHVGDRVARPVAVWPGQERDGFASAWGGFAEYGIVRDASAAAAAGLESWLEDYTAQRQMVINPALSLTEAVLSISLAETASWANHLPSIGGKNVVIAGTGIAGLSITLWCKMARAEKIVVHGRRDERLRLARVLGADETINSRHCANLEEVTKELLGGGADLFVEAVGDPEMVSRGLACLRPGGIVAIYGVPEGNRHTVSWSHASSPVHVLLPPAEEHLARGWVEFAIQRRWIPCDQLMTHQFRLDEIQAAFDLVAAGRAIKAMVTFDKS